MYEKPFAVEIVTPSRVVFQGEATSLSVPGFIGGFQVLYNHAPLLSALGIGVLKIKDRDGHDSLFATSGGFVEVKNNRAVVLAESAESAAEIDITRAQAAMDRAKQRLSSPSPDIDVARAEAALMRALNRLRLSRKP